MHYLYWYYGQLAGLCGDWNRIYIGITSRTLAERDREHVYQDWWWRQFSKHLRISRVFETRREAKAAEEEAIYKYQPFGNNIHNQRFTQSDRGIYLRKINLFLPEKPKLILGNKFDTVEKILLLSDVQRSRTRDVRVDYLHIERTMQSKTWKLYRSTHKDGKHHCDIMNLGPCDLTGRDDLISMPTIGQPLTPTEVVKLAESKLPEFVKKW